MTDYSSTISFCKALNRTEGENSLKNVFLKEMTSSYNEAHENMITRFDVLVNGTDGKDIYVNFSDTPIRGVIDVRKKQGAEKGYMCYRLCAEKKTPMIINVYTNSGIIRKNPNSGTSGE